MPTARVNGVELFYEELGAGNIPLVLVHGSWSSHRSWALVAPRLAESFRVVTYDRRGHSQSERPPGQGSIREDVDDLAALIEWLGLAPCYVVGSSFGSIITLRLAINRPDLLRGIVIHEPPLLRLLEGDAEYAALVAENDRALAVVVERIDAGDHAGAAEFFAENVGLGKGSWAKLPPPVRETFIENAPTYADENKEPESLWMEVTTLRSFTKPVLASRGGHSPAFFAPVLAQVVANLPHADTVVYEAAGHIPQSTHPDAYVESVAGFVKKNEV
jgi:pimeloyl-ACP methyl ester carboxylesterase